MSDYPSRCLARLQPDGGQTMVEYAILLTMIALVVITILQLLGTNVVAAFTSASAGF